MGLEDSRQRLGVRALCAAFDAVVMNDCLTLPKSPRSKFSSVFRTLIFLSLFTFTFHSEAHQTSQAFLTVHRTQTNIQTHWDIALKDLHFAYDLDTDRNGEITWGEVRAALPRIEPELLKTLSLSTLDPNSSIPLRPIARQIDYHLGSAYLVFTFDSPTPSPAAPLRLNYNFFFDIDPTHRALLNIDSQAALLTAEAREYQTASDSKSASTSTTHASFFTEGIWHIWTGYDHILFLLALLLPVVIVQGASLTSALREVAKVVTAFTVAHSITLSLAACGIIALPGRLVEPIIGASVLIAAINNLVPMWRERGWFVAFGFGLIHGFGFASALQDVGLAGASLAKTLLLFNLGVETGQLAVVALFLPVAFAMRNSWFYRGVVFRFGSIAISVLACFWVVQRML